MPGEARSRGEVIRRHPCPGPGLRCRPARPITCRNPSIAVVSGLPKLVGAGRYRTISRFCPVSVAAYPIEQPVAGEAVSKARAALLVRIASASRASSRAVEGGPDRRSGARCHPREPRSRCSPAGAAPGPSAPAQHQLRALDADGILPGRRAGGHEQIARTPLTSRRTPIGTAMSALMWALSTAPLASDAAS